MATSLDEGPASGQGIYPAFQDTGASGDNEGLLAEGRLAADHYIRQVLTAPRRRSGRTSREYGRFYAAWFNRPANQYTPTG